LCFRRYDEVAQRAQHECVEIIDSVAGCLNLPKEGCSLVHHFMKNEEVLKMEKHHQSITITHFKFKVLRGILDGIFMNT